MKIAMISLSIITAREANKERPDEHPGIQSPSKSGLQGSKSGKHSVARTYMYIILHVYITINVTWFDTITLKSKPHVVPVNWSCFDLIPGSRAPQKVQFVDQMTRVLSDHLPDLWRLGQAYFSGKLHKDVRTKHHFRKNAQIDWKKKHCRSYQYIVLVGFQVKDKNSKVDSSKQNHFKVTTLVKNCTSKSIIIFII